jgi:uncharacterized membrane protein
LKRKIDLCENAISIYDKVDPGQTTQRINVMFELHCAKVVQIKRKMLRLKDSKAKNEALVSIIKELFNFFLNVVKRFNKFSYLFIEKYGRILECYQTML